MLKINNVSFSYDNKKIFSDFSFELSENDRVWLHGESGCGKTTLLRLILGLEKPQYGEIVGTTGLKPSVVFQEDRLLPFKTALQNIMLVNGDRQKAIDNLKALGLGDNLNTPVNELSGGMCRRVAIARALSVEFDYLILDEPFTGLDKENVETAIKLILKTAENKPIILATHSPLEAELLGAVEQKL